MSDNIVTSQKLKYLAKVVGGVLHDRFEYGKAFETVQSLFPDGITIKNYNLREDGTFSLDGTTSTNDNVDLLEKTVVDINSGTNDRLLFAKLTSLALKDSNWNFNLEVTLK
jgi:hypothetical protein